MHKLLILDYDHNQKKWYQNLAKKAFLSIIDTSFLVYWVISHVSLYYKNYYRGKQRWYHTTLMPKNVYIAIGLYLTVFLYSQ